jgi:hypothetical protein
MTKLGMGTERWDLDAYTPGRFKNGGVFGNLQLSIVNRQMNHGISPSSWET